VGEDPSSVTFHRYVAAYPPCSGKPLLGSANLQVALLERFEKSLDYGIYNCRPLTTNAAVPSIHSDGRAGDLGFPVVGGSAHVHGYLAVGLLIAYAWPLGIMGIIWDRRRWDYKTPGGRSYTGPNPHIDHIHWEQVPSLAVTLTAETAYRLIGEPMPSFTPQEIEALIRLAPYADTLALLSKGLLYPGPTTGKVGSGFSLIHLLEVYRLVAQNAGIDPLDHVTMANFLSR
jgi:hypothetical protein